MKTKRALREEELDYWPVMENDPNAGNKYFVTREQMEDLYCGLLHAITSSCEPVDPKDESKWRYMHDREMISEIEKHQRMKCNLIEPHVTNIRLLKQIVTQRIDSRKARYIK